MPIRLKMFVTIMLVVFAVTAISFITSLSFTNQGLNDALENDLSFAIEITDGLISNRMQRIKSDVVVMAEYLQRANSEEAIYRAIKSHVDSCPKCLSHSIYSREGLILYYGIPVNPNEMLVHSREMEIAFGGKTIISSPFYNIATGDFIMNIYTPLGPDKILSISISGLALAESISDYRLWRTGNIYIVNSEGTIIAHQDIELVLNQLNFIKYVEENPGSMSENVLEISKFLQDALSNDKGIGAYNYMGKEYLCSYTSITDSLSNWRVIVAVPLHESPKAGVQRGLLSAALSFLVVGIIISIVLSKFIARPFRELEKLNETVRIQNERTKVLLDAVPLTCLLWDKELKVFALNQESLKLFSVKDEHEYMERFLDYYPEYQPDGELSKYKYVEYLNKAFEEGRSVFEWVYKLRDGTLVPTEVTLVRVLYGDDFVVAGYARDLREHKKMIAEIERRGKLMLIGNQAAEIMLTESEESIEISLMRSMEIVGKSVYVDRIQIWRNETINGELYFVHAYEWRSDVGQKGAPTPIGLRHSYSKKPDWEKKFIEGEYINCTYPDLSREDQTFLNAADAKMIVIIPLFLQDKFWGFFGLFDCRRERIFSEDEINIMRSVSLLMANSINRSEQAVKIREAHKRVSLLLDTTPLGVSLWNREYNVFDCNEELVKLLGAIDKNDCCTRFHDFSPEYQPDGILSRDKASENVKRAFEEGKCVFEWVHLKDGAPMVVDVTLVRVEFENEYAVAGYIRDLREHKKMMQDIEQRNKLSNTVNDASSILLQSDINAFVRDLFHCMGMFADALSVDHISIWKNNTQDKKLYFNLIFEWTNGVELQDDNSTDSFSLTEDMRYSSDSLPNWEEFLSQGNCIFSLERDITDEERQFFTSLGGLSVFIVPVFIHDQFWGFVCYSNSKYAQTYNENEQTFMRSGSLAIANALLQNETKMNLHSTAIQLETALISAQKANSAKSDFLANMSHAMRTPLNAIIGLSGLILENNELDEESVINLENVYGAGITLLKTVNDILDISKIEASMLDLVEVEYDVTSLINNTITQNIMRIEDKPIELKLDISEDVFTRLRGDELRVEQMINNLLSNAIKYTDEGTVKLSVRCTRDKNMVWVTVKVQDTGRGVRHEDYNKLFEEYAQLDKKSNRKIEGTGLGLPLTKKLTELMGGSISVDSKYGKGSTFTIKFLQKFVNETTISSDVVKKLKSFQYSDKNFSRNKRIKRISLPYARVLVVDDNMTNLDVAKGLMKPYGMQIDCVNSGQRAIDAIRAEDVKYNAIFMDHMMPEMDGITATKKIREIETDYAKKIPIIALTANAIAGNAEMFLSKGFQAFLAKPIDVSHLDSIIHRHIRDMELEKTFADQQLNADGSLAPNSGNEHDMRKTINRRSGIDRRKAKSKFAGLDINKGIERFGGDKETYYSILSSFAKNTRPLLVSMQNVDQDKLADYAITAHGIKGSSRGIHADMIGDCAENLEKAAKSGDFDYVNNHNQTFLDATWKLIHDIEEMLSGINSENIKPKKDKPDKEKLSKLLDACRTYDMDGAETIMEEIENYQYESDDGLVDWLRENVNLTNFKKIVNKLSDLPE